jgi:hypothetical protein
MSTATREELLAEIRLAVKEQVEDSLRRDAHIAAVKAELRKRFRGPKVNRAIEAAIVAGALDVKS